MTNKVKELAVKAAVALAAPALGLAMTAVPAQAATDTNLSGFGQAGIGSAAFGSAIDGQRGKTIGNQQVSPAAATPKDAIPDNPNQKLPDKVSAAVPDDATVVSKNLAVTNDGQVKNVETGRPVTNPRLVGTQDQQPDPLAKTDGNHFIPVEAGEVKQAVQRNGGDADTTNGSAPVSPSSAAETVNKPMGAVHNVGSWKSGYGAYWGSYNGTEAFFESGGALFAQQAKGVVDVSEHQGNIDWQAAKNDGIEGAIIRVAFGWGNRLDYQAARNVSECKRLGIPFGVYFYSYSYDNNSAWGEGNDAVNKLHQLGVNPGDLSYPVFYDLENWTWTGHAPATNPWVNDGIVKTWYGVLSSAGYRNLSVYSYTYYLNTALNTPDIRNNTRWVASYGPRTNFPYLANDRGWQYADNGWISGIGSVDLNAFGNRNYVSNAPNIGAYRAASLPNDTYYISSLLRDSAGFDVPAASTGNGARIQLFDANRTDAQKYQLNRQGDGSYEIRNVHSNKVLDVPAANAYAGAPVQQWDANGTRAQRWYLRNTGNGGMYIQSALGNFVLDLPAAQTGNCTQLHLWDPNMTRAQQFLFSTGVNIPGGYLRIGSALNGNMVMDVPAASTSNFARMQVFASNNTDAQKFKFRQVGNAVYEIVNAHSGKAIDLAAAIINNGNAIQQFDRNNTCSQHWLVRQQGAGMYSFYSACAADKPIDIPAGLTFNGNRLQIFDGNGTYAQRWWLTPVKASWE